MTFPKRASSIIFYDQERKRVVVFLRDNIPTIPFPGMIDIPGGAVEEGESAEKAIVREMAEELDDLRRDQPYVLKDFKKFKVFQDEWGIEQHIFYKTADFDISDLRLKEGQEILWFTEGDALRTQFAYNLGGVVEEFFEYCKHRDLNTA